MEIKFPFYGIYIPGILPGHTASAVNLKGIWPRRVPKARAIHAAGGLVFCFFLLVGNLDEAAASAASMQFTALTACNNRRNI